jgi:hypothetical protein
MIPREEMEVMNTNKDDGHGNDEVDNNLDNLTAMVILKAYKSNSFCNTKWIVQWVGAKGESWFIF